MEGREWEDADQGLSEEDLDNELINQHVKDSQIAYNLKEANNTASTVGNEIKDDKYETSFLTLETESLSGDKFKFNAKRTSLQHSR